MRILLDSNAQVNQCTENGYSPLIGAAVDGRFGSVRLLLVHQADPSMRNDEGESARDKAIKYSHTETVSTLNMVQGDSKCAIAICTDRWLLRSVKLCRKY